MVWPNPLCGLVLIHLTLWIPMVSEESCRLGVSWLNLLLLFLFFSFTALKPNMFVYIYMFIPNHVGKHQGPKGCAWKISPQRGQRGIKVFTHSPHLQLMSSYNIWHWSIGSEWRTDPWLQHPQLTWSKVIIIMFIIINDQWGLSSLGRSTKDLPNAPPKSPNKLEITWLAGHVPSEYLTYFESMSGLRAKPFWTNFRTNGMASSKNP